MCGLPRLLESSARLSPCSPGALVARHEPVTLRVLPAPNWPTFAIRVGDADAAELAHVATATGDHLVAVGTDALPAASQEIHGYL